MWRKAQLSSIFTTNTLYDRSVKTRTSVVENRKRKINGRSKLDSNDRSVGQNSTQMINRSVKTRIHLTTKEIIAFLSVKYCDKNV